MDDYALRTTIDRLPWYHSIDLGHGVVTPGVAPYAHWKAQADLFFNFDLSGKSVLDIGCYDGFFSFEAHRRGATRVLATDHFVWQRKPERRESFQLARNSVFPDLTYREMTVDELTPQSVGIFDVVLFAGVLYHLKHPLLTRADSSPCERGADPRDAPRCGRERAAGDDILPGERIEWRRNQLVGSKPALRGSDVAHRRVCRRRFLRERPNTRDLSRPALGDGITDCPSFIACKSET